MSRSTPRLLAAAALAALVATLVAAAPAASAPTAVADRAGDTRLGVTDGVGDIRRVVVSSTPTRVMRVVTIFDEPTPAAAVSVNLRAGGALYQLRRGRLYRVSTFAIEGGRARLVGRAGMRSRGRALTIAFSTRPLGRVPAVAFQVRTLQGLDAVDIAPRAGFATHRLTAAAGPRRQLRGPSRVVPGRPAVFAAIGFPARARVTLFAVPTRHRGGNAFGVAIPRAFRTNSAGAVRMPITMPRVYQRCLGQDCSPMAWRSGEPVDVDACTTGGDASLVCARLVTRIR